ncbi:hypothetical protein SE337_14885 [Pseudomonas amygdali pv. sesami]
MRDLLLIDEKVIGEEHVNEDGNESKLFPAFYAEYKDARRIQHVYAGDVLSSQSSKLEFQLPESGFPVKPTTNLNNTEDPISLFLMKNTSQVNSIEALAMQDFQHDTGLELYLTKILNIMGISSPTTKQIKAVLKTMLDSLNGRTGNVAGNLITKFFSGFFRKNNTIKTPEYLIEHIKTLDLKTTSTNGNLTATLIFTSEVGTPGAFGYATRNHPVTFVPVKASPSTLSTYGDADLF